MRRGKICKPEEDDTFHRGRQGRLNTGEAIGLFMDTIDRGRQVIDLAHLRQAVANGVVGAALPKDIGTM
jgi:hypothetical protein